MKQQSVDYKCSNLLKITFVLYLYIFLLFLKGKCKYCAKTFQSKLAFGSSSSVVGLSCSWCKYNYHHKGECLNALENDRSCDLGNHSKVIFLTKFNALSH